MAASSPAGAHSDIDASKSEAVCTDESSRAFDFWLGHWTAEVWGRPFGGTPEFRKTADLRAEVVSHLGGCLVVEHVQLRPSASVDASWTHGYSARFLDRATEQWHAVLLWPNPGRSRPYEMTGSFHHGRGEFFRTVPRPDGKNLLARFTFSDISSTRFRWDSAVASSSWSPVDFGNSRAATWFTESKFEFHRSTSPTLVSEIPDTCDAEVADALSDIAGNWSDSRTGQRVTVSKTAGGCAWELQVDDPERQVSLYALLAYDSTEVVWKSYVFEPGRLTTKQVGSDLGKGVELLPNKLVIDTSRTGQSLWISDNGERVDLTRSD